ncbi:DUF3267 domain-containing protein [Phototrophicus methaneseepsis]|uniref:DUF3267 domain-containing protein n=1 Tax=Phototrophicus methaneseepsis TaxID=2710758 RepID=A0A7S8ECG6_9CHLR|nr:DUF3267 domain-containing protein [Phototrophicus methaneseepsis]QPC84411.1 DUF3267 domain-containing protein [Phototrophicus methaneseepsis]
MRVIALSLLTTAPAGYRTHDYSVSIAQLPSWVIWLSVVLMVFPALVYLLIYGWDATWGNLSILALLVEFVVLIVAHELVHAIGWKFASGLPWAKFRFGILWQGLAPYCHAIEPMSLQAYRIGAILPLFITGVLPWLVALVVGDTSLAIVGALLISGAVGDIYVIWTLRALPASVLVQDHTSRVGCVVYMPTDESPQGDDLLGG